MAIPVPRGVADLHARFCGMLTHRYFIRVHMSVMLGLVLLSGVLASRLLLRAGLTGMEFRYPLAVVISYLAFFGLVRIWLAYVCRVVAARSKSASSSSSDGGVLDGSWGGGGGSGGSGGSGGTGSAARFFGGGGGSGGGGASSDFGDADLSVARSGVPIVPGDGGAGGAGGSSSSPMRFLTGGKGGSGGGGGGGGDGDGLLLLILFGLLVAAILGAGAYLVYQAPAILSEAAFQAVLAGGLVRTARGAHDPGWAGSVLKATAIPFVLVLVLSGVFGYEAHKHCPGSHSAKEVLHTCVFG